MKNAAIYVRVSTPDQHVESQLYDLRELAAQRGFEVVHEYEDRGVCGKKARRPGLDALMADARRKSSPSCWWRHSTALRGALEILMKGANSDCNLAIAIPSGEAGLEALL
jgi:hypothetical protein